jgi:hypothetical protein
MKMQPQGVQTSGCLQANMKLIMDTDFLDTSFKAPTGTEDFDLLDANFNPLSNGISSMKIEKF